MKKILLLTIISLFLAGCSVNQKISDVEMIVSGDNKFGAFLINGETIIEDITENKSEYNELWIYDFNSKEKNLLVKSGKIKDLKIANINEDNFPFDEIITLKMGTFSNDSKYFYFFSEAWTTSSALFSVNIETGEIKFITDSNYIEVIKDGDFQDMLITNHHRYYEGGGSYDFYYITDPITGKDIKEIGQEKYSVALCEESVKNFIEKMKLTDDMMLKLYMVKYKTNWNSELKQCFVSTVANPGISSTITTYKMLFDVQSEKLYAFYDITEGAYAEPLVCFIYKDGDESSKKKCRSEEEYDNYVKSFMEDDI